MPSGLAIVAIAVIWAAVIIPRMAAVYERSAAGYHPPLPAGDGDPGGGRRAPRPMPTSSLVHRAARAPDGFDQSRRPPSTTASTRSPEQPRDEALSFARAERETHRCCTDRGVAPTADAPGPAGADGGRSGPGIPGPGAELAGDPGRSGRGRGRSAILLVSRQHALAMPSSARPAPGAGAAPTGRVRARPDHPRQAQHRGGERRALPGASRSDLGGENVRLLFPAEVVRMTSAVRAADREARHAPGSLGVGAFPRRMRRSRPPHRRRAAPGSGRLRARGRGPRRRVRLRSGRPGRQAVPQVVNTA